MSTVGQTVACAGEDAVLEVLTRVISAHNAQLADRGLEIGPGADDAAVLAQRPGTRTVLTTDTMSQDQDFRAQWWEAEVPESIRQFGEDVGVKAAAQNLSDINAMGAVPRALLVSLTLPHETTLEWVQGFFEGVVQACSRADMPQCVIAGGDLGTGPLISASITAVGEIEVSQPALRRATATPGDTVAVIGQLGWAAAGLAILESPEAAPAVRGSEMGRACVQAQLTPEPDLTAGHRAVAAGARSGMDISDGLMRDAQRLARASTARIQMDHEALQGQAAQLEPIAQGLGLSPEAAWQWTIAGGEEYGLLTTFPAEVALPEGFYAVGRVLEDSAGPKVLLDSTAATDGWDSFK